MSLHLLLFQTLFKIFILHHSLHLSVQPLPRIPCNLKLRVDCTNYTCSHFFIPSLTFQCLAYPPFQQSCTVMPIPQSSSTAHSLTPYMSHHRFSPKHPMFLDTLSQQVDPTSYSKVVRHKHWRDDMAIEIQALEANNTWLGPFNHFLLVRSPLVVNEFSKLRVTLKLKGLTTMRHLHLLLKW